MAILTRRRMLKAAGVTFALPWLETLARADGNAPPPPRRMVCICSPLGINAESFFPKETGKDYTLTPYLEEIKDHRDHFTVMSGLAHPDVGPSHDSMLSFLTGAPHPENRAGFRNSVSLDQFAATRMRGSTRYDSLTFGVEAAGLAWTASGAPVPAEFSPARVFKQLFIEGTPEEVRAETNRLSAGRSILDALSEQRSSLRRDLAPNESGEIRRISCQRSGAGNPLNAVGRLAGQTQAEGRSGTTARDHQSSRYPATGQGLV